MTMSDEQEEMREYHECPERDCGIEMPLEELHVHLQWDHNRTESQAEAMLDVIR